MPTQNPDFASVTPQFPLNSAGAFGPNALIAQGRFYTASGGMVGLGQVSPSGVPTGIKNAGPQGWPGMGATLVGTGRYNIMHPPATVVSLGADIATPSGVFLMANQFRGSASGFSGDATLPGFPAQTGITQLQVFGGVPTGNMQPVNPPTGTRFDLRLTVAPTPANGLTQF